MFYGSGSYVARVSKMHHGSILLFVAACSSTPATTPPNDAGASDTLQAVDAADASPPRSAACTTQDQQLQAALDGARKSPNALLAVKNPACGNSVYVSGDPKTAGIDSLWRIGSVTKTYVSASILSLVKENKVGLDDLLSKWVPNVKGTTGVTVKMLLDHRSGIFDYTSDQAFLVNRSKPWTPQQIVDLATASAPYFAPDAGYHYSNTNYVLLGMILEAATSTKAGVALHARAIDRAKLTNTLLDGEDTVDKGRMAHGFTNKVDVTLYGDPTGPWTAGAMVATGADVTDWISALYGSDAVLDAPGRALLVAKTSDLGGGVKYGLGVLLLDASITAGAGPAMGHNGAIDGFETEAFYFAEKKTAIVAVTNKSGVSANDITLAALVALFP